MTYEHIYFITKTSYDYIIPDTLALRYLRNKTDMENVHWECPYRARDNTIRITKTSILNRIFFLFLR